MESKHVNIIALCIDSLRKADLSIYGFPFDVAPRIHELSKTSTVFTQAYSPSSTTGPVLSSVFSGNAPSQHKVYTEGQKLEDEIIINKNKSYDNICISANPWITEEFGFHRGWDDFKYVDSQDCADIFNLFNRRLQSQRVPFFAFLHFMDVHIPFTRYWADYCRHLDMSQVRNYFSGQAPRGMDKVKDDVILALSRLRNKIRKTLDAYRPVSGIVYHNIINSLSSLARFDSFFGDCIDELKRRGMRDSTAFIIFSDHGNERNEHNGGRQTHNHTLYNEVVNVPFIVHIPGKEPRVVEEALSIVEFHRMVENIQNNKDILEGITLNASVIGQLASMKQRHIGYLLKDNKKLIKHYSESRKEFYDLVHDPREKDDLYEQLIDEAGAYEQELDSRLIFPSYTPDKESLEVDEQIKERLESLGYLG